MSYRITEPGLKKIGRKQLGREGIKRPTALQKLRAGAAVIAVVAFVASIAFAINSSSQ